VAAAVLASLVLAGCQEASAGPPTVDVSLVAPTSGATVKVRTVVVLGRVNPADARVLVAGRRASVRHGVFRLRLRLPLAVNQIGILAFAKGYRPTSETTTVRVSRSGPSRRPRPPRASRGTLPSDFGTRGAAICSAAIQKEEALPRATTAHELATAAREDMAIMVDKNRQLSALAAPYRNLPAVRRFLQDMQTKLDQVGAVFRDALSGRQQAAAQVMRANTADAPRYWQDAGRLGMPNCGAIWVSAGG
jgi:glucodextranase-like protein